MHGNLRTLLIIASCYGLLSFTVLPPTNAENTASDSSLTYSPPWTLAQLLFDPTGAALKGKQAFEKIILTDQQARELGFDSRADAADSKLTLGFAFPLYIVSIELLKTYNPTIPPTSLITFARGYIVPVHSSQSGQLKSSIVVVERTIPGSPQPQWKPVEWGKAGLIKSLEKARPLGSESESFAIRIPALGRYFVGVIKGGVFSIVPLYDEPKYGFVTGVPKSAIEVFTLISKEANAIPVWSNSKKFRISP